MPTPRLGVADVTARDSFGLLLPSPRMRNYNMYNFRTFALVFGIAAPMHGEIVASVRASGKTGTLG